MSWFLHPKNCCLFKIQLVYVYAIIIMFLTTFKALITGLGLFQFILLLVICIVVYKGLGLLWRDWVRMLPIKIWLSISSGWLNKFLGVNKVVLNRPHLILLKDYRIRHHNRTYHFHIFISFLLFGSFLATGLNICVHFKIGLLHISEISTIKSFHRIRRIS